MVIAIIVLSIVLGVTVFLLIGSLGMIKRLEHVIVLLDKEEAEQNKYIIQLMKDNNEMKDMLLQHIEILKYLCERDPLLSKAVMPYMGPIGEA